MRTPNLGTIQYQPGQVPSDPAQLMLYVGEEFRKIALAIQLVALGHLDKTFTVPSKPRDGDIRYADGTQWNPGSGQGIYYYNGSAWSFLG